MKVHASEILNRTAAPLPGAGAFPPRPRVAPPTPGRPVAPPAPGAPEEPNEFAAEEPAAPGAEQPGQQEGQPNLQTIIQEVSADFADEKVERLSKNMLTLMKVVPPDHSEKMAKVFTKMMEAIMAMKANIAALQVMTMPQMQQQQIMQKNLQQLNQIGGQPIDQGIKSGPLT